MNLIIDIGNSFTKVALFKGKDISHLSSYKTNVLKNLIKDIKSLKKENSKINKAIISVTGLEHFELERFLSANFELFTKLNHKTKIPINNLYKSPETLGKDRLSAVVAANNIFPNNNVLVFDSGTALTIDFINKERKYFGGSISPGIMMRFKALNYFTDKLPEIKIDSNFYDIFGKTTEDAIKSGVQNGILNEVEGYINKFSEEYSNLKIIFTGGDTFFFEKRLKKRIFADPNLVLRGLNIILEYNAK